MATCRKSSITQGRNTHTDPHILHLCMCATTADSSSNASNEPARKPNRSP